MATNIVYEPGEVRALVVSYPTSPASGEVCIYGSLTGLALTDEDSTTLKTDVHLGSWTANLSVFDSNSGGIAVGKSLFASEASPVVVSNDSTGVFLGYADEIVLTGATTTIRVIHPSMTGGILSSGAIGTIQLAALGVTPEKLSTVANSRPVIIPLGAVAATKSQVAFVAPTAGVLAAAKIVNKTAITANDTDYWTFALVDKGSAGTGTDKIVELNTKATGGSALVAYVALSLGTLNATHKVLAAGDVVLLTITKSASATALAETALELEFLPTEV